MGSEGFHDRANERAQALLGRTIDERYQIDKVLAMGGMGTVYLARHLKLKKRVALKVLHPDAEDHPELFLRFEREALAGAQVTHPNVAAATDFGELPDGSHYLVMEYVRGTTLRQILDGQAPIPFVRTTRILRQIATALAEIHKRGIVHRDLKPRNVMAMENDVVKVVDFGLAKIDDARNSTMPAEEDAERLTGGGVIFGTVDYLAPEAALGMELVDHRADLYALGVIAYEMLSGKRPFEGANDLEVFTKQRTMTAAPLAACTDADVPDALEAIVFKLLEKDVTARFQSAGELISALDAAVPEGRLVPEPPADLSITGSGLSIPAGALTPPPGPPSAAPTAPTASGTTAPAPTDPASPATPSVAAPSAAPPSAAPPSAAPPSTAPPSAAAPSAAPPSAAPPSTAPPSAAPASSPARDTRASNAPRSQPSPAAKSRGWPKTPLIVAVACGATIGAYLYATSEDPSTPRAPSDTAPVMTSSAGTPSARVSAVVSAPPTSSTPSASSTSSTQDPPPSATPAPSAAPSASTSAASAPLDASELGALEVELADEKTLDAAITRADRLLVGYPKLLADTRARAAIKKLLVAAGRVTHPRTAELFERVGSTQGAAGPDLIYELLESSGRARWAKAAQRVLASESVRALASPELTIAFDLRFAPCNEKIPLVDVAAERGDARAIIVLDLQARGCFKDARKVDEALAKLRLRLKQNG